MTLLVLVAFLCLAVYAWGHGFEDHVGASDVPDNVRFRVLRDKDMLAEIASRNSSESHRRLTIDYWASIKEHVTQQKLHELAHKHIAGYATSRPFPHMVAEDIFPQEVLEAANLEIPDNPENNGDGCVHGARCYNGKVTERSKNAWFNQQSMGPATQAILTFMKSQLFVHFLERITGIEEIVPDAQLIGGGIHQTLSGGFLSVHADFNKGNVGMHRRVNVFLYLNPDWKDEYGGHLELWSRDLQRCEARISPDLGKLTVFSSTDFSYHGHQNPLTCPENRSRRSLAVYYYSKTRPSHECLNNDCDETTHSALWQTTLCPSCKDDRKCYHATA